MHIKSPEVANAASGRISVFKRRKNRERVRRGSGRENLNHHSSNS
jgi:hypothetical protein